MSKFNTMSRALNSVFPTIWWRHNKSNMADGRHFENRYISISQPRIVRIWRNLVCRRKFWPRRRKREKISEIPIFKTADGTPYWKSFFFGYNSAPYCPIKTKFGMRRHNRTHTKV